MLPQGPGIGPGAGSAEAKQFLMQFHGPSPIIPQWCVLSPRWPQQPVVMFLEREGPASYQQAEGPRSVSAINQMTPFEKLKAWGSWVVLLPCIRGQVSALSAWRSPGAEALGQGRHRMGEIGLCGKVPHTGAAGGGGREETCAGEQMPGAAPDGSGPEQKEKSQREGGQRNRGLAPLRLPKWRDKIRFLPGTWLEACSETSMQPQTTLKKPCNPEPKWPTVWVPELENCWDSNSAAAAFSALVL